MIRKFEQELHCCEENQVADKRVKRCLTGLLIGKMQNKTTMGTDYIPTTSAKIQSQTMPVLARQGHWKFSSALGRGVKRNICVIVFISS